jgi:Tol biopolymer transport system component
MRRLIPLALALALAAPAAANAAPLPTDTTAVISGTSNLLGLLPTPVADSSSARQSVNGDGTRVAFVSHADGLLAGDDDDVSNVYVSDTVSGAITLVSRSDGPNGEPSHSSCNDPVISDDGLHVAFTCTGALDPADTNGKTDVYLRDLVSGTTMLVSRAPNGPLGNERSFGPSIDATGAHVAFTTDATNLYPGLTSRAILRRDVGGANLLTVVTGNGEHPSISNDGTRVAFDSGAPLDATGDTNDETDVYVRDLTAATTTLASRADGMAGKVGNNDSLEPEISGDGKFVAFTSNATNFAPEDTGSEADVYRRSLTSGATQLVSATFDGHKGSAPSLLGGIDDSGERVSFVSSSTNLVDESLPAGGVYAYVKTPVGIVLASRRSGAAGAPLRLVENASLSGNGLTVAFSSLGGASDDVEAHTGAVVARRLDSNATLTVSRPQGGAPFLNEGGWAGQSSVSADGRYVAFSSSAPAFGLPAGISTAVVVRDTVTGATSLVSRQDGPNGALLGPGAAVASISADGRRVAFAVTSDGGGPNEIYVRDIPTGRTYRIDRADGPGGAPANSDSFNPAISANGNRVAFTTLATNLVGGDTDDLADVYVRDIAAGRTLLASRADGAAGAKGNGSSEDASLSGDGSRVAFASRATNLGDGDTDERSDVHVRDLAAGRTLLASSARGFPKGDDAYLPSISDDGKLVSFASRANYGTGTSTDTKLYLRDLAAGTVSFAKVGGTAFTGDVYYAALSGDGSSIAFSGRSDTSIDGASTSAGLTQVYVSTFDASSTRLVSRRSGANGAALAHDTSTLGGITADGSCVTYDTSSRVLPSASSDFDQVYMRALKADCGGRAAGAGVLSGDRQAPRLSNAKLSRKRFRVSPKATALTARRVPRGTVLSLRVSEAARLTVTVDRRRVVRRGKTKRTRYTRDGVLVRNLRTGAVRISFSGRLARKRLAVGVHRLTLVARDAAGNKSKPVTLRFTVVR